MRARARQRDRGLTRDVAAAHDEVDAHESGGADRASMRDDDSSRAMTRSRSRRGPFADAVTADAVANKRTQSPYLPTPGRHTLHALGADVLGCPEMSADVRQRHRSGYAPSMSFPAAATARCHDVAGVYSPGDASRRERSSSSASRSLGRSVISLERMMSASDATRMRVPSILSSTAFSASRS